MLAAIGGKEANQHHFATIPCNASRHDFVLMQSPASDCMPPLAYRKLYAEHKLMYPCTHVPIYPCIHVPMYLCTHVPMYPCTHAPMYPCTHVPMYPCSHLPMYRNSNEILSKFYRNSIEILSKFYRDSIEILSRFYWDSIEILSKFYRNSIEILSKACMCWKIGPWNHKLGHVIGMLAALVRSRTAQMQIEG